MKLFTILTVLSTARIINAVAVNEDIHTSYRGGGHLLGQNYGSILNRGNNYIKIVHTPFNYNTEIQAPIVTKPQLPQIIAVPVPLVGQPIPEHYGSGNTKGTYGANYGYVKKLFITPGAYNSNPITYGSANIQSIVNIPDPYQFGGSHGLAIGSGSYGTGHGLAVDTESLRNGGSYRIPENYGDAPVFLQSIISPGYKP